MQEQQEKKPVDHDIRRSETLGIPLYLADGDTSEILFKSDSPEYVDLYVMKNNEKLELIGSVDFQNFLKLCERAMFIWEEESKEK